MTLEQRVEKLERQNRWMRRMGAVGVALLAALVLIGQGKEQEVLRAGRIEARGFAVVEQQGKPPPASLGVGRGGYGSLVLMGQHLGEQIQLNWGLHGPRLYLHQGEWTPVRLKGDTGNGILELYDKDGKLRFSASPAGLELRDAEGKVIWKAPGE
jgi:hypothetical protein